jgi:hypothetical protein
MALEQRKRIYDLAAAASIASGAAFAAWQGDGTGGTSVKVDRDVLVGYLAGLFLSLSGGTLTGALRLPGDPSAALDAAPKQYVDNAIAALVNSAPGALDTLKELADALGDDANFAATMTTALAGKLNSSAVSANGLSLIGAASYAAMKTLLAIAAADITDASANARSLIQAANYAAMRGLLGMTHLRLATQFDKTGSTALSAIPDLTATLTAGASYRFRTRLFCNVATGGSQAAINGSCTATDIKFAGRIYSTSALAKVEPQRTALGGLISVAGDAGGKHYIEIEGSIVVNAGGSFGVQYAQNASDVTSSVLTGSYLELQQIS